MTERAQNADFRRKPQIFADSPLLLEIQAFGGRRKPQIFAENRRFSKKTAGNRRLGSVTLGASPLARPYFLSRFSGPPRFTPRIVGISLQFHFLEPNLFFSRRFSANWGDQNRFRIICCIESPKTWCFKTPVLGRRLLNGKPQERLRFRALRSKTQGVQKTHCDRFLRFKDFPRGQGLRLGPLRSKNAAFCGWRLHAFQGKTPCIDQTCADCPGFPVLGPGDAPPSQASGASNCAPGLHLLSCPFEQILGSAAPSFPTTRAKTGHTAHDFASQGGAHRTFRDLHEANFRHILTVLFETSYGFSQRVVEQYQALSGIAFELWNSSIPKCRWPVFWKGDLAPKRGFFCPGSRALRVSVPVTFD